MSKLMTPELNVTRFANEDVIATSPRSLGMYIQKNGNTYYYYTSNAQVSDYTTHNETYYNFNPTNTSGVKSTTAGNLTGLINDYFGYDGRAANGITIENGGSHTLDSIISGANSMSDGTYFSSNGDSFTLQQ